MKLIFSKNDNNEIDVKIQKGTIVENFTYTEMVRQLITENNFEETDFGNLSVEEEGKIKSMLNKVSDVFKDEESKEETDQ